MESNSYLSIKNDIYYALLGITGDNIVEAGNTYILSYRYNSLDEALRFQVNSLVHLGWYYRKFKSVSELQHIDWKSRCGLYELAIFDGISDLLSDYESDVGYLEENDRLYGNVTLSYIVQHLQKYLCIFPEVNGILCDLVESGISGCQILNYLNEFKSGIPHVKTVISRLLTGVRVVLVKQIYSWMLFGEIDEDFFVSLNTEAYELNASSASYSCRRLSMDTKMLSSKMNYYSGYLLVPHRIPSSHITPQSATKILFAGKAIKLMLVGSNINTVGKTEFLKYLSSGHGQLDDNSTTLESWNLIEYFENEMTKITSELYAIHKDPDSTVTLLEELIEKIYSSVTNHLWTLLKGSLRFINYFYALRNIYLLGKGELFQSILDQIIIQTETSSRDINNVFWIKLVQNVAKTLGIDEEGAVKLLSLKLKEQGSIELTFCEDNLVGEDLCLIGSVVNGDNKIVLCPPSSSANFTSSIKYSSSFNTLKGVDCFKGGMIFMDLKSISYGFSTALDFNFAVNSLPEVGLRNDDIDLLLCSLSYCLSPSVRELEVSLSGTNAIHRFGAVSFGVSLHGIMHQRSSLVQYQCQIFFAAGDIHRVAVLDMDENLMHLGSSLKQDSFVLQVEYLQLTSSARYSNILRVRLVPTSRDNDYSPWSLEIPIDLTKYLTGGNAFLGIFGLSLKSISVTTNSSVPINLFSWRWKSFDPILYLSASSYTSANFPDTAAILDTEVSRITKFLCLDAHLRLPNVYQIVYDGEMIGCYRKIFSYLMKVRMIGSLMEKLLIDHPSFITDRVFCHLKHSMHFFINNLLYYLQVDVIDAQFTALEDSLLSGTDFQSFLRQQKKCLSNIMRMSMMNNSAMLQSINKVLHCCVRFISICRIVENQSNSKRPRLFVPSEEYDDVRVTFFAEVKSLLVILRNVDNGGFLFRLDFNEYFSSQDV